MGRALGFPWSKTGRRGRSGAEERLFRVQCDCREDSSLLDTRKVADEALVVTQVSDGGGRYNGGGGETRLDSAW